MSYLGEQRPLSDPELIAKTRQKNSSEMSEGLGMQYCILDFAACFLIENKHPSKGYKVTLSFPGCVNAKIEGSDTDSKTVEVKAGGGSA